MDRCPDECLTVVMVAIRAVLFFNNSVLDVTFGILLRVNNDHFELVEKFFYDSFARSF